MKDALTSICSIAIWFDPSRRHRLLEHAYADCVIASSSALYRICSNCDVSASVIAGPWSGAGASAASTVSSFTTVKV